MSDVARLSARLADVPPVFASPPDPAVEDGIDPFAVLADLFRERADRLPTADELAPIARPGGKSAKRRLELTLLASWLVHDRCFAGTSATRLLVLFGQRLPALAEVVSPRLFVDDADRREELVRHCLDALGLRPEGERPEQAADRLAALDSLARAKLVELARQRELARRAEELARLRAQEEEARRQAARATHED